MAFGSRRFSCCSLAEYNDLPPIEHEEIDIEAQLNEKVQTSHSSQIDRSLLKLQLSQLRWKYVASALFNLLLFVALLSIVGGAYLANRKSFGIPEVASLLERA